MLELLHLLLHTGQGVVKVGLMHCKHSLTFSYLATYNSTFVYNISLLVFT